MSDTAVTIAVIIFIAAMFTNFFGLGDVWANKGSWYTIKASELDTVMQNLHKLHGFDDEMGVPNDFVKVKAYAKGFTPSDGVYYQVKIPDWIFNLKQEKLTDEAKAKMLGISL